MPETGDRQAMRDTAGTCQFFRAYRTLRARTPCIVAHYLALVFSRMGLRRFKIATLHADATLQSAHHPSGRPAECELPERPWNLGSRPIIQSTPRNRGPTSLSPQSGDGLKPLCSGASPRNTNNACMCLFSSQDVATMRAATRTPPDLELAPLQLTWSLWRGNPIFVPIASGLAL